VGYKLYKVLRKSLGSSEMVLPITIKIFALILCVENHNAAFPNQQKYRLIMLPLKKF
jgi:hypothetical protein